MIKILLVEDDLAFSNLLKKFLTKQSFQVATVPNIQAAIKAINTSNLDLILLDYRLPDGTAIDLMRKEEFLQARVPVIIMTTFHDIRTAVKTMKMGAMDYITKPINTEEVLLSIRDALKQDKKEHLTKNDQWIKGKSEKSRKMHKYIMLVAPTDFSVLIQGESGVGKEYVARTIHEQSNRMDNPFVAVDCGALSPDLAASELFGHTKGAFTSAINDKKGDFELASGGTLFLDEISNLNYENQIKLLRVMQEKLIQPLGSHRSVKVDIRIITATNDDLYQQVKKGLFREDLYHRINEFKIIVPPLRERDLDLELFVDHFVKETNLSLGKRVNGLSKEVKDFFMNYRWPGNLRELRNIIKRAILLTEGNRIEMDCLPKEMINMSWDQFNGQLQDHNEDEVTQELPNLKVLQEHNEKLMIISTLKNVKYNKSKAAQLLNIDRKTLYNKLSKYDIE